MAVKVNIGGDEAAISDYRWTGENTNMVMALNALLDPRGPSGADPDPDFTAAQAAIRAFGGEILEHDELEYIDGMVY